MAKGRGKRSTRHQGRRADRAPVNDAERTATQSRADQDWLSEIEHIKKRGFLAAYTQLGTIREAADAAGVSNVSHYYWLRDDPVYAEKFSQAKEIAARNLEDEATRRAMGWMEPIFDKDGNKVGVRRKYSDTLLIFRLNGEMSSKYRQRTDVTHDLSPAMAALLAEWDASAARPLPGAAPEPPSPEAEWAPMLPEGWEGAQAHGPRGLRPEEAPPSPWPEPPRPAATWPPPRRRPLRGTVVRGDERESPSHRSRPPARPDRGGSGPPGAGDARALQTPRRQ